MLCPACQSHNTEHLFEVGCHPTSLVDLTDDPSESAKLPTYPIYLEICRRCSHVFNRSFNPKIVGYKNGCHMYNNGRNWKRHVSQVVEHLNRWNVELAIEIGAGDCSFLSRMDAEIRVAVDPCDDVRAAADHGITYYQEWFDVNKHMPRGAYGTLVIMRHLLEHFEQPREFLEDVIGRVDSFNDDAYFYIEVPCCEKAIDRGRVEDWTYEHPQHFTLNSLRALLRNCECDEFYVSRAYNDEVLCAYVKVKPKSRTVAQHYVDKYQRINTGVEKASEWLTTMGDKVAYWGGAGKSAMFLRQLNVPATARVVDSDSSKWLMYVPGTSIKIMAPEVLKRRPPRYIVATTSWRAEDIRDEIKLHGIECEKLLKFEGGKLVEVPFE